MAASNEKTVRPKKKPNEIDVLTLHWGINRESDGRPGVWVHRDALEWFQTGSQTSGTLAKLVCNS